MRSYDAMEALLRFVPQSFRGAELCEHQDNVMFRYNLPRRSSAVAGQAREGGGAGGGESEVGGEGEGAGEGAELELSHVFEILEGAQEQLRIQECAHAQATCATVRARHVSSAHASCAVLAGTR